MTTSHKFTINKGTVNLVLHQLRLQVSSLYDFHVLNSFYLFFAYAPSQRLSQFSVPVKFNSFMAKVSNT